MSEAEGMPPLLDAIHLLPRGEEDEIVIRNLKLSQQSLWRWLHSTSAMAGWEFSSGDGYNVTGMGPLTRIRIGIRTGFFYSGAVTMGQFL